MRVSFKGLVAVAALAALALGIGVISHGTAQADPCSGTNCFNVPSQGEVGGGSGVGMTIECKWELPDMSPYTLAMTYEKDDEGIYDDTPGVPAEGPACAVGVACANNRHNMMGITPNPDDKDPSGNNITRQYEKWVAVQSTSIASIIDVYWDVWEPYVGSAPNGPNCTDPVTFEVEGPKFCFKYQHHATATKGPPNAANPLGSGETMFSILGTPNCWKLTEPWAVSMFEAAVGTGQMTQAEADDIVFQCGEGKKAIFRVQEDISKEQPPGEYRVQVTVVNSAPANFTNVNYFDVVPFIHIKKDFTKVDWQNILNGVDNNVFGDHVMQTPGVAYADGSGVEPTIENVGNERMFVSVHFSPLVLGTKEITQFDTRFQAYWRYLIEPLEIQKFPSVPASTWVCFHNHPLGSNDAGKIDFSVHPIAAGPGVYQGSIDILGTGGGCP